jgi:hypothetical protein
MLNPEDDTVATLCGFPVYFACERCRGKDRLGRCSVCHGSGLSGEETCRACHGRGYVKDADAN